MSYTPSVRTPKVVAQHSQPMPHWRDAAGKPVEAIWIITDDGRAWTTFTFLCASLGIVGVRQMRERTLEHAVLGAMLLQLPVDTAGGRQLTWCLERRALGFFLGTINVRKLRPDVQPRLLDFQEQLVDVADRFLHGEVEVAPAQSQALSEIHRLKGAQADALSFVLTMERRIGALEHIVFRPEDASE